jgi:hypothetical protein
MAIEWRQDARTVVRWIDSLPTDGPERDAIIEHPDPTYNGDGWWGMQECGCLVGCVIIAHVGHGVYPEPDKMGHLWSGRQTDEAYEAGWAFPELTAAFSPERAWAWAKKRAARPYRTADPPLHSPQYRARRGWSLPR